MIISGVALVGAFAVILGIAVLWDRTREPHRDPTRPMVVVDNRTYQDAQRRILLGDAENHHQRGAHAADDDPAEPDRRIGEVSPIIVLTDAERPAP